MAESELELRPYRDPQDRPAFMELYRAIYGRPYGGTADADAAFAWMYREAGDGRLLATAAFAGEQMAAFYGIVPVRMRVDGKDMVAAQSLDSMTHPDFQRRGLFAKLGQLAYRETCHDIPLVFGFPNENALPPRVMRLGWMLLRPVPRFGLILREPPLPARLHQPGVGAAVDAAMLGLQWRTRVAEWGAFGLSRLRHLRTEQEPGIPDDVDELWQEVRDDYRVSVLRDRAYLTWRYDRHPSVKYTVFSVREGRKLRGLLVLRLPEGEARDVMATEWLAPAALDVQLAMAEKLASVTRRGRHRAAFVLNSFRRQDVAALLALGFVPLPQGRGRMWLVPGVRANTPEMPPETVCHIDHWRLSYGDMDVG